MKKLNWGLGIGFFLVLIMLVTIPTLVQTREKKELEIGKGDENKNTEHNQLVWNNPLNTEKIVDKVELYQKDKDGHVDCLYITILPPIDDNQVTFKELNENYNNANADYISDAYDPVSPIFFATSEKEERYKPNATIEIRGQSSRNQPQKSYKIKLYDETTRWKDFKTLNLNKHFSDKSRIVNKLSFDFFEEIGDFPSLRTGFVNLYVKDLSNQITTNETFKNYGLYTFIEQPNKSYLQQHGLDKNGHFYKAEFFEFYTYEEAIKPKEDILYDENLFSKKLEIRGNDDHHKLINMLKDVNDYNKDINEVVDQHFDRDNLLTWLGVNILLDNYDTNSRNFLLYSPLNSDKWFFIPWDYDGGMKLETSRGTWQKGLSNYWGMVLFNRFFKDKRNVEELNIKINDLSLIINKEKTLKYLNTYYDGIKDYLLIPPDWDYLMITEEELKNRLLQIADLPEINKSNYFKGLNNPMPFYLNEPMATKEGVKFSWQGSYDLQDDALTYEFILSKNRQFDNILVHEKIKQVSYVVEGLQPDTYYWKVIAWDDNGNRQEAYDYIKEDTTYYGTKKYVHVLEEES